jgi:hypothetical protein
LSKYRVFRAPYQYQDKATAESKLFVCVCHESTPGDVFSKAQHVAICMKATSQTAIYENNKELLAGVVLYGAGELPFFPLPTAIQPDNLHPIPHLHLARCDAAGTFAELGDMPSDFHERLIAAVNASVTIPPARRKNILQRIS